MTITLPLPQIESQPPWGCAHGGWTTYRRWSKLTAIQGCAGGWPPPWPTKPKPGSGWTIRSNTPGIMTGRRTTRSGNAKTSDVDSNTDAVPPRC
ncbi:hypothetical protein [Amycolatopsis balhimycina]|uniref:hypothetical protein n=1 Tax=Amycolatopsis balhimycina TaxID=208443 RepID=UPI000F7AA078|nr:hypothetical protein [Amycolatopsis balhimycina]